MKRDRAKIYELYIKTEKKKSFFAKYPELSMQWHPTKNLNVKPDMVRLSSNKKIWWQCEKGHEWEASIANRRTTGCPFCSGQRVCADNCLQTLRPELAKQWHPTKNGNLTPSDVTIGTSKKVWWRCEKGHEWEAPVHNRTKGYGCSICSGHQVSSDNSLLTLNPELAKQWHPSKNGDLTSSDVTVSSNRKIWWICEKGHEWETSIAKRTIGRSCPYCSNQRVHKDNCMQTLSPELAKQWHSTKNGNLTPRDVTIGSGKKVWWQCKKGHEWQAAICDRSRGRGCPFCSGKRKC
ncbi:MAG: zinc-ribbon domain-containing protein [Treponema sp.]|nr:zinc-ribbon domain-containing protein [Treponema sp.]